MWFDTNHINDIINILYVPGIEVHDTCGIPSRAAKAAINIYNSAAKQRLQRLVPVVGKTNVTTDVHFILSIID